MLRFIGARELMSSFTYVYSLLFFLVDTHNDVLPSCSGLPYHKTVCSVIICFF